MGMTGNIKNLHILTHLEQLQDQIDHIISDINFSEHYESDGMKIALDELEQARSFIVQSFDTLNLFDMALHSDEYRED